MALSLLTAGDILAQSNEIFLAGDMVPVSVLTASGAYRWPCSEIEIGREFSPQLLNIEILTQDPGNNLGFGDPRRLYQIKIATPGTINGFVGIDPTMSGNWNWKDPGLRPDSCRTPGENILRPQMNTRKRF